MPGGDPSETAFRFLIRRKERFDPQLLQRHLLDVLAAGLLAYAGALAVAARRQPVDRHTLMVFTIADGGWVVGSAIVLVAFWTELAPLARVLVIAVALVVEMFATLQFRAAGRVNTRRPQIAWGRSSPRE